jgi:hypothetical protein
MEFLPEEEEWWWPMCPWFSNFLKASPNLVARRCLEPDIE